MSFRLKASLLALAIGVGTVVASTLAIAIPFGDPIGSAEDWAGLSVYMLAVALPFLALALLAERSRLLWGSALAVTLLLWGYYVVAAISYRLEGSSVLAHMGFDLLLFFYPLLLTPVVAFASEQIQTGLHTPQGSIERRRHCARPALLGVLADGATPSRTHRSLAA